jgi:hypothetical protein
MSVIVYPNATHLAAMRRQHSLSSLTSNVIMYVRGRFEAQWPHQSALQHLSWFFKLNFEGTAQQKRLTSLQL